MSLLSAPEIQRHLEGLDGWTLDGHKLHRTFKFADFRRAFGFMASVATAAEAANHHPEWHNVYGTVEVWLTTHDASGITAKDIALAHEMDRLAQ